VVALPSPLEPDETQVRAYLEARLAVEVPGVGWVDLDGDASGLAMPLWLITAWNPRSVERSRAENDAANQALRSALVEAGIEHLPAVGRAPDGSWEEPGFALMGVDEGRALELGRRFEQHALYRVDEGAVTVVCCFVERSWSRPRGRGAKPLAG